MAAAAVNVYGYSNWEKQKETGFSQAVLVRVGFRYAATCTVCSRCLSLSAPVTRFLSPCTNYHCKRVSVLYEHTLQRCHNGSFLAPASPCSRSAYVKCISTSGSTIFPSAEGMSVTHS